MLKKLIPSITLIVLIPLISRAAEIPYEVTFFDNIPHGNISISADGKHLVTAKEYVHECKPKNRFAVFGLTEDKTVLRKIRKESSLPYFHANTSLQTHATIGFNHCGASDVFIANIWGTNHENNFFPLSDLSGMFSNHFDDAVIASDYSFILKGYSIINNYVLGPVVSRTIENIWESADGEKAIFLSPDNTAAIYQMFSLNDDYENQFFRVVTSLPNTPEIHDEEFGENLSMDEEENAIDPIQWAASNDHAYITVPNQIQKVENFTGDLKITNITSELPDEIGDSFQTVISPNKKNAYFLTNRGIYYIPNFTHGDRIVGNIIPLTNLDNLLIFQNGDEAIAVKNTSLYYIPQLKSSQQYVKITNAPRLPYDGDTNAKAKLILNPINANFYLAFTHRYSSRYEDQEGVYAFHRK